MTFTDRLTVRDERIKKLEKENHDLKIDLDNLNLILENNAAEFHKLEAKIEAANKILKECPFERNDAIGQKDISYKFIVKPMLEWVDKIEKALEIPRKENQTEAKTNE
jgi:hypothetical protein